MGPIDYTSQIANPFQSAVQGMQLGAGIQDMRAQQQANELKVKQQQDALQRAQQIETARQRFFANPKPSMKDAAELASLIPESQAKAMQPYLEGMSKEQQQGTLRFNTEVLSALQNNPETAIKLLRQRAEGERNAGDKEEADLYQRMADSAEKDGAAPAFKALSSIVSALPGAKEMFESASKQAGEQRAAELHAPELASKVAGVRKDVASADKAEVEAKFAEQMQLAGLNEKNWNVKNLQSQISTRAKQLNLDQQMMQANVAEKLSSIQKNLNEIPADTRKLINEAATLSAASKQSADQFNDLAKRLEAEGGGYGAASSAAEWLKKATGSQGQMTQMRQEYTRLRNQAAIKSLPPGPATDKDIELAMRGFPGETADAKTISQFLRGMAKLQDIEASVGNAKTDWLAQNNGQLGRAKNTFIAGDFSAKPGETFTDFSQRVVQSVSKNYGSKDQSISDSVARIPTKDNKPAPVNIRSQADAILSGGR